MIRAKHFKFTRIYRRIHPDSWAKYCDLKKIEPVKRTETHKFFLKQFRQILSSQTELHYKVMHLSSREELRIVLKNSPDMLDRVVFSNQLITAVRLSRRLRKSPTHAIKIFRGREYKTIGGVFTKSEQILKLLYSSRNT